MTSTDNEETLQLATLKAREKDLRKWKEFYEKSGDEYRVQQYTKYHTDVVQAINMKRSDY